MTATLTHFDLNVFIEYDQTSDTWSTPQYHFVVYSGRNGLNDYDSSMVFEPTAERIARFHQVCPDQEDIWFGYDGGAPNELEYILFGTGGYVQTI